MEALLVNVVLEYCVNNNICVGVPVPQPVAGWVTGAPVSVLL